MCHFIFIVIVKVFSSVLATVWLVAPDKCLCYHGYCYVISNVVICLEVAELVYDTKTLYFILFLSLHFEMHASIHRSHNCIFIDVFLSGAGVAHWQCVGAHCPAACSVLGSILPWGESLLVEGIFPFELTWVLTPFPESFFG